MKDDKFKSLIKKNDPNSIKQFLLSEGKSPKPFCPFYFEREVLSNGSRGESNNERIDEGDQGDHQEAEISK